VFAVGDGNGLLDPPSLKDVLTELLIEDKGKFIVPEPKLIVSERPPSVVTRGRPTLAFSELSSRTKRLKVAEIVANVVERYRLSDSLASRLRTFLLDPEDKEERSPLCSFL